MTAPYLGHIATDTRLQGEAAPVGRSKRTLSVAVVGSGNAQIAPGGGEIQLRETSTALIELGLHVEPWREDADQLSEIDVLHIFGSLRERLPLVVQARRQGVALAVSPIAWFDMSSRWHEPGTAPTRMMRMARFALAGALPRTPTWRRRLYLAADVLLPNSAAEQEQLQRRFALPAEQIRVVPNAASQAFASGDPNAFAERVGGPGFVLIPGRIEPRKNQRNVLLALRGQGLRTVVLGDPVPGHEGYAAQCREVADASTVFHPRLDHADPLLASAYAGCGCVALASWFETPGLVALEAGLSGAPVAITERGCTREYFGDFAHYANPADPASIRQAIRTAAASSRSPQLAQYVRTHFSWQKVAEETLAGYEHALWKVARENRRRRKAERP